MLRRFVFLTAKDLRLIIRSHFLTVVVGLAVVYALAVHFVIPANLAVQPGVVLWDTTTAKTLESLYVALNERAGETRVIITGAEATYREALETSGRIGLKVLPASGNPALPGRIEITYQGHESPRARRILEASLRAQGSAPSGLTLTTTTLRDLDAAAAPPPFNMSTLPVLVLSEAALIGLLLAAALLFSEKEEGTLRAYRVTPGGLLEYLLAKAAAMGLLGVVFTVILTVLTLGLGVNWPGLLAVVFTGAVVVTLIALLAAGAFKNLSQFLFTAVAVNVVLALPAFAYLMPSFSPVLLKLLPTYPLVFALREALFPAVGTAAITGALAQMGLTLAIILPLTYLAMSRQLTGRDAG